MSKKQTTTHLNDGADLQIAQPEDFGIKRDDNEQLVPVKQRIPGTDYAIRCKPLVDGAVERWEDVLEGENPDDDRVDAFLREYVEEGIGSDGLSSVPDYLTPSIIEAVKRSSGYEVFQKLQKRREERNLQTFEQLENVPEGVLMKVLDMDEEELEKAKEKTPE